jgi:PPOX class probable F420-dependent enzyme
MSPRTALNDADRALLQAKNFATVSTLRADGTILNVPVWVDVDGDDVVLNSETTRAWPKNLRERGQVTITVLNHENPYEYVSLSGRLESETTDGAFEHGDRMAQRYLGVDEYPYHQEGDVRVLLRIRPDRITHVGG